MGALHAVYRGRVNSERLEQRERVIVEGEDLASMYVGRGKDRGIPGEPEGERTSAKNDKRGNVPAENEEGTPNTLLREEM